MKANLFSLREEEIFKTLKALSNFDFVVIGGYAVNAYALPRFSVDCDIVVKDDDELKKIRKALLKMNYKKARLDAELQYSECFSRYDKKLENKFAVSVDILISKVTDRMTRASFTADWVFQNSKLRALKGKTISEELKVRIINIDALLVMKIISCRPTDIRDVFMMMPESKDKEWIKSEVKQRYNLGDRMARIMDKVASKQFKDGLSGVYGGFDVKVFEKYKKALLAMQNEI